MAGLLSCSIVYRSRRLTRGRSLQVTHMVVTVRSVCLLLVLKSASSVHKLFLLRQSYFLVSFCINISRQCYASFFRIQSLKEPLHSVVCYGCKFYSPLYSVLQNYSFCRFVRTKHHLVKYFSPSAATMYSVGVLIRYSAVFLRSIILILNFNYCLIIILRSSCPSIDFICQQSSKIFC
jgi:hypothetical protein